MLSHLLEPPAHPGERSPSTFLARERQRYAAGTSATKDLLQGGGPAGAILAANTAAPASEKAALVLLARVLFNLDEFITRE